jgi:RNA 3'-terminal phosphate cyclase-like protein
METGKAQKLRFRGCTHFRQRVVNATLSGKPIRIDAIRADDEQPGVRDFEASFLRLIDKLTNGTKIEVNETGTKIVLIPGFIVGGKIQHECATSRAIGWYLEGILPMCAFAKMPVFCQFTGVTNNETDISVDNLRTVTMPLVTKFGLEGLSIKIKKRGAPPEGGGQVNFTCPIVRELKPVRMLDQGLVKRIRGVAYCTKMSAQTANLMVEAARGVLNRFIPDIYIYTDHYRGAEAGLSPGFAISLVAETTEGCFYSSEATGAGGVLPASIGKLGAMRLCEEMARGGCIDATHQSLMFTMMTLSPEDVTKVRTGPLTQYSIKTLRHLKAFFGTTFKLKPDPETGTVFASCLGKGYKNMAKKVT